MRKKELRRNKILQSQSGITLTILVVTIVVILILAGITYDLTWKDNGIIKRALGLQEVINDATAKELNTLQDADSQLNALLANVGIGGSNTTEEEPPIGTPASPSITVNGDKGENGFFTSNVEVVFHKKDALDRMTYKIEGVTEETTIQDGETISLTVDGTYTIIAYAYNAENTQSRPTTVTIVKDTVEPTVSMQLIKQESTGVQVQVVAEDPEPGSGMSTNQAYTFYYKQEGTEEWKEAGSTNASSYTYTNLQSGITYSLRATAKDKAGNIGTSNEIENIQIIIDTTKPSIDTDSYPTEEKKIKEGDPITITIVPTEKVKVDPDKFIPVDKEGNSTDAVVTVTEDEDGIHIQIIGGTDEGDVDIKIEEGGITDENGNPNDPIIIDTKVTVDNTPPEIQNTEVTGPTVVKQGEQIVITLTPSEPVQVDPNKIKVEGVTDATVEVAQEEGKIQITVTAGEETGTIQVKIEEGAIQDIAGNSSAPKEITGYGVDNQAPTIQNFQVTNVTQTSITTKVQAEDVGPAGLAERGTYEYHISTDANFANEDTIIRTEATYTFEELQPNTIYYIKVIVKDAKENKATSTVLQAETGSLPEGNVAIRFGESTWKNEKASITIVKQESAAGYNIEYQVKDASNIVLVDWTTTTADTQVVENLLHGYQVIARVKDDKGNTGKVTTASILDNQAPIITLTEQTATSNATVTITVTITENESGMAVQKYLEGEKAVEDFEAAGMVFTSNTIEIAKNGKITVYAEDKAGNKTVETITVTKIDTKKPTIEVNNPPTEETTVKPGNTIEISITPSEKVTIDPDKFVPVGEDGNPVDCTVNVKPEEDGTIKITITTGEDEGKIKIEVQPGAITDEAGNENEKVVIDTKVTVDSTMPDIQKTETTGEPVIKQGETIQVTIQPTEEVTVDPDKIILTGTGATNATKEVIPNPDGTITIQITAGDGTGDISITLEEGALTDKAGNTNPEKTIEVVVSVDNSGPTVTAAIIESTTNSIKIKADATDVGAAGLAKTDTYTYSISTSADFSKEVRTQTTTQAEIVVDGLKADTTYYVKVVAKDAKGNETTSDTVSKKTGQLPEGDSSIQFSSTVWESEQASIVVSKKETVDSQFTLQYRVVDATGTVLVEWTDIEGTSKTVTGLLHGYTIEARLLDASGNTSGSKTYTIQDTKAPILTVTEQAGVTNGNVTITVTIVEEESGIAAQKYAIGNQTVDYFETNGTEFTGTTFEANANGVWTVYAIDKAGNAAIQKITVTKQDVQAPTIANTTAPTEETPVKKGTPTEIILTPSEDVEIDPDKFIPVDESGNPTDSTVEVIPEEDGTIRIQITPGEEEGPVKIEIQPGAIVDEAGNPNEEITIPTNLVVDNTAPILQKTEATGPSILKEGEKLTFTFTPSEAGTIHPEKVKVTGEGAEGSTLQVLQNGNGTITIIVTAGTGTGVIQIEIGQGAFTDKAGNESAKQTITGYSTDNQAPTITAFQTVPPTTTSSFSVKVTAADEGPAGIPTTHGYVYHISKTEDFAEETVYTENTDTKTFTGLEQNTTYYVKVVVIDAKGNEGESSTITGKTLVIPEGEAAITFSEVTWLNEKASVTIRKVEEGGSYTLQYQVVPKGETPSEDNWITVTEATKQVSDLVHDTNVMARLKDEAGNVGNTTTISILDKQAPTITLQEQAGFTKGNVTITATIVEQESGIAIQKYAQGNQVGTYFQTAGTEFTGTTFEATANGIWTVYVEDKAGNAAIQTINVTKQDITSPTIQNTQLPEGAELIHKGDKIEVILTPSEEVTVDGNKFILVDETGKPIDSTVTITEDAEGKIHIEITAGEDEGNLKIQLQPGAITDEAGNPNTEITIPTNTKIDNTKPDIQKQETGAPQILKKGEKVTITLTPSEEVTVDTSKIVVSGDGAEGASKTTNVKPDGSIVIVITAGTGTGNIDVVVQPGAITDKAGNPNVEKTFAIVAKTDNAGPTVSLSVKQFTTNSIQVQVVAEEVGEAGLADTNTYTYTLSTNAAFTTGIQTKQTTEAVADFGGLKNNTTYYIKVVAIDKKGNSTTSNTVTQTTGQVPEGETHIEFGTVTWENETASLQVQKGTSVSDEFDLEYKIVQNGTLIQDWQTAAENPITITDLLHNDTVIARLTDTEGNTNGSKSVTVQDTVAPTIALTEQSAVTNGNVTVTATITENESGVAVQKYAQGNQTKTYFQTAGTEFEGTHFEATANGAWTVYVKDKAGNETIQTITVTKQDTTKPEFSNIQVPTDRPVVKKGETIVITLTPNKEVTMDENKFRVVDEEGNTADSTLKVTKTDGTITVTITAGTQDGDIRLQVDKGAITDKAGNQSDARTITTQTKIDNTKPVLTVAQPADKTVIGKGETTTIQITASEPGTLHPEAITLTGTGSTGATITTTQENTTITLTIAGGTETGSIDVIIGEGAFTDKAGNPSVSQTLTAVVQTDASAPTITKFEVTDRTTSTITVETTAVDVGLAGLPTEGAYTYSISKDPNFVEGVTWEFPTNSPNIQFTSLEQNTTYYIKVQVKDTKGNAVTSDVVTAVTTAIPSAMDNVTFSDVTWSNHAGNVTITKKEEGTTGYTLQYKITDAAGKVATDWTHVEGNSIALTGIANGSTVHARLWDGNSGGSEKEKLVEDTTGPVFSNANIDMNIPEGYGAIIRLAATDENGLSETEPYIIYYRKKTETEFTRYVTTTKDTNITSLLEPATTYIIYMEAKDYFGNTSHTTENEITNADAVAKIDSTIYGTLQRAMVAVPVGTPKTITMLKSVTQSGGLDANKTATLDLNGTTLNGQVGTSGTLTIQNGNLSPTESSAVHVYETGVVNLESTLTITTVENFPTVTSYGTVNVNGASIHSKTNALINYADATMHINSGNVQTTGSDYVTVQNNGTLNFKGGTIGTGTGGVGISNRNSLTMTGGTLDGTKGNGLNNGTGAVMKITGGNLQGGTEYPLVVNENELTIDGSSVTLTGGSNLVNNKAAAVAYLKNGSFHETGNSNSIYNFGTIHVSGGTYVSDNNLLFANEGTLNVTGGTLNGSGGSVIHNLASGTANISGGKITSTKSGTQALLNYGKATISGSANISGDTSLIVNYSETAQIDVTGGTITATGSSNAFHNLGIVNFSGATLTSQKATALSSEKTLNIKGGAITSDFGNAVYTATGATTTVTGGTLKTTDDYPVIANYGRTDITNSAANITGTGNGIKNNTGGTVNVSAGTISTTAGNVIYNLGTMTISGTSAISGNGGATVYNTGTLTTKGSMKIDSAAADVLNEGTWNMQGGTITCTSTSVYGLVNSATFNMSGGTIQGSVVPAMNQSKFNLSAGTVKSTTQGQGFQNNQGGTFEFTGGTIGAPADQPLIGNAGTANIRTNITRAEGILTNSATGVFNLISGTMTCSGAAYYPFYNLGTLALKGATVKSTGITPIGNNLTFNASSGSITATGAGAVFNAGNMTTSGSVNITSNVNTIYNKTGTAQINGGTIHGTGDGYPTVYIEGGTVKQTAGTISHSSSTNYSVYQAGGTFTRTGGTVGHIGP